ncbi:Uncharacterised protein [uncultured Clostridium sp.]|uniref:DUF5780 domain-containing protein n=1 Tax=Enterocloster citroniae TaxID=358743 RepID=UPI0008215C5A|nr:DUF5780 domain-containing protein [Enterocloster citroniae]SCI34070.1 Uncharacterised protein [uncultured Clostridium sp.]
MKRSFLVILSAVLVLGGCGGGGTTPATDTGKAQETASGPAEETTQKETTQAETAAPPKEVKELSAGEFDELLAGLPVSVVNTEYIVQDDQYKSLYPDLLSTVIQNHTDEDIKDAVLAIVAWDSNKLPVKLVGNMDFQGGEYFKKVNYRDINLVGGGTFGEDSGFSVDESCKVDSFKTIILSFETFDGDKWKNPYEDSFRQAYEGKKYTDDIKIQVEMQDADFVKSDTPSGTRVENASAEELEASLASQPVFVSNTNYAVQNDRYKSIYPDLLQAIIQNNSEEDIRDAVLAFVAWDSNGLPVKIKGQMSFNDPTYVTEVLLEDINLVPGSSYGDSQGYAIDENCAIESFKAMVVSYTTFEDKTWENPEYKAFCDLYEGKRLTQQ